MMIDQWPEKDPDEVLDYDIDWAGDADDQGRAYGDPIVSSIWFLDDSVPDALLIIGADSFSDGATKVWLSGGTLNKRYQVTNRVTTVGARTMDKSGLVIIREK